MPNPLIQCRVPEDIFSQMQQEADLKGVSVAELLKQVVITRYSSQINPESVEMPDDETLLCSVGLGLCGYKLNSHGKCTKCGQKSDGQTKAEFDHKIAEQKRKFQQAKELREQLHPVDPKDPERRPPLLSEKETQRVWAS